MPDGKQLQATFLKIALSLPQKVGAGETAASWANVDSIDAATQPAFRHAYSPPPANGRWSP
jgi:hypothetical protein